MGERRARRGRRRVREFEAFVAGAGGRLLHAAALLTGEPPAVAPAARQLLEQALSCTYADWDRLRADDPYLLTMERLADRFARSAWRYRRPRGGLLGPLPPRERLVLVLRLHEGVADEQVAASLGLPVQRVRELCVRGMAAVLSRSASVGAAVPAGPAGAAVPGAVSTRGGGVRLPDRKEREVRELLDAEPSGPRLVPPDLAARAALRGTRLRLRRRVLRMTLAALFLAALLALVLWAAAARPWEPPPMVTTPVTQW